MIMEKTNLSGRSLEKELFINATPERVFQALTEKAEASSSSWRPARANLLAVKAHVSQVLRAETAKLAVTARIAARIYHKAAL